MYQDQQVNVLERILKLMKEYDIKEVAVNGITVKRDAKNEPEVYEVDPDEGALRFAPAASQEDLLFAHLEGGAPTFKKPGE